MTMMRLGLLLLLGLVLVSAPTLKASDKAHLAVLDLDGQNATQGEVEGISEILRAAFVKAGRFVVVDRTLTQKILDEWALTQSGVVDEDKAIDVGKLLNVRYIVTGRLNKIGMKGWQVSVVLLDVQTGETLDAKVLHHEGDYFSLVEGKLPGLAAGLAGGAASRTTTAIKVERPDRATRKQAEALVEKGDDLWDGDELQSPEKAVEYYSKAIQLDPGLVEAHYGRGSAYLELEDPTRALADFDRAIQLNPQFADAYYDRGNAHAMRDEYDEAIQDFNEAIRLKPNFADAYSDRGDTWLEMKRPQSALADFNRAIELDPEHAYAFYGRGNTHEELGNPDLAIADYEQAIRLDDELVDAYYDLGLLLMDTKNQDRACELWRKACALGLEKACVRVKSKC